jgi:hypothetical protein
MKNLLEPTFRAFGFVVLTGLLFGNLVFAQKAASPSPSQELEKLFLADQSDSRPNGTPEEAAATDARARERRNKVSAILASGSIQSGEDYFRAALVFQHGNTPQDHMMAHILATIAGYKGYKQGRWLSAAALDAYLRSLDKQQIFGTAYLIKGDRELDEKFLSDALREEFCVPSAAEQQENVKRLVAGGRMSLKRFAPSCEENQHGVVPPPPPHP